jgi:oligopeptide transport system substrate-binding protein
LLTKRICLLLAVMLTLTASLGCGWFGGKRQPADLRYAIGASPETVDPRKSTSIAASIVQAQLFEGLTTLGANNNPLPAAAERWETSADGLTYRFYLRPDAKWSNGQPVTAADFEYAWKSALSPELASSYAYQLFYLKNGEAYNENKVAADAVGVRAVGEHLLEVTLERPTPYFISLVAFHTYYPVNRQAAQNEKWAADARTVIGNGPFKLTRWVHENKMELAANEHYWDAAKVRLKRIDLVLVDVASTVLVMFENRQLDLAENPPVSEIPRLAREGKLQLYPFLGITYYNFNVQRPPFDNPKVRQAFSLAIDRRTVTDHVVRGGQQPALAFVPSGVPDAQPGQDFRVRGGDYLEDNDVVTARRLLAEAGYADGRGLPPITLLYNTNESNKAIAEAIQEMWRKNLGVTVELANQEWKVFLDNLEKHNFQVSRDNWIGDYVDPMTFLDLFATGGGNNSPGYANPDYDSLLAAARSARDPGQRMQALHEAEKLLLADAVVAPIYFNTSPVMIRPNVKGQIRTILGVVYLKEAYVE